MKNKSKRRQRIFALFACVCLVCSMFVVSSSAVDRIRSEDDVTLENLSGTTWVFNTELTRIVNYQNFSGSVVVSYTCNDSSLTEFTFLGNDTVGNGGGFAYKPGDYTYGTVRYYYSSGWVISSVAIRTVTFTSNITSVSGSTLTSQMFLDWLKTNAELQVEPEPVEDLMSDVGDVLSGILSDVGDVANSIVLNPVLLLMCIGLPIISVVCGFLARLKNRT